MTKLDQFLNGLLPLRRPPPRLRLPPLKMRLKLPPPPPWPWPKPKPPHPNTLPAPHPRSPKPMPASSTGRDTPFSSALAKTIASVYESHMAVAKSCTLLSALSLIYKIVFSSDISAYDNRFFCNQPSRRAKVSADAPNG